ncbi:MAG TPA: 3-deoxy-manno-octulosonate cytidylyltransferase [Candidatus Omnitrophota bacterium]|nr:3-deoxy-manno-octulosonate cytidylyltransferase [Candidatus Omnitrophota bacterium]
MKAIGIIPARWGSTRLQGKILANIAGKPMIQHVWERAKGSRRLNDLLIACDDERILKAAKTFGAKAVLTSKDHQSGSDRIAEAVKPLEFDIVVNIQGDEPLIAAKIIDDLVDALNNDADCQMATVVKPIVSKADLSNPNVVKVVVGPDNYAVSFSRQAPKDKGKEVYKHLGIYAYRKNFLLKFSQMPRSKNEEKEKLEQLRALDGGYKIKTVKTKIETIGVDTADDLEKVKAILAQK